VKRYYRDEVPEAPIPEEVTKGGDCTLMGVVLLDQDEWLSELIAPLGESLQPIRMGQNRVVDLRSRGERGDLVPDVRHERFLGQALY
jgi:hypothetical protein